MAAVMAAITPLLSSKAVTMQLLSDKNLPPSSDGLAFRLALSMCGYEQFWNLYPPPCGLSSPKAATLAPHLEALPRASGAYKGMLPCFLDGLVSLLFCSISRARMIW
ncbi:unnamed protein product [marine sediment metagenome]|uniref:Uncharacterized protein n=1 Tax=marine sediment metagenome TaxID=412755 RepID=X0U5H4_9ZZZZ